jgi:hypothetical protein
MIETILPFLFGAMMIMVVVWFVLITRLFNLLKTRHPVTYEKLGSPSLFYNNSIKNNHLFLKFLFKNEFKILSDPGVTSLSQFMKWFLVTYMIYFLFLAGVALIFIRTHPLPH